MKQSIAVILILSIILSSSITGFSLSSTPPSNITSESAILIDAITGDILYEKNSNKQMYPASTTKIMTAILTLENTNMDDKVVIDKEIPFLEISKGSRIYALEGEVFTVEQLLYALLVDSANDAATALAKHISGSIEEFTNLMNKRAKELGAKNTHFNNPNGMPDSEHLTTAYDLAMIAKYAMTLPKFKEVVNTVRYQIPPTNIQSETRYLKNTNRLLWGVGGSNKIKYNGEWVDIKYDIVDGIKTGYTTEAQQCLVATATKDGRRVISVVLKAIRTNVYLDTRTLLDYGFDNFKAISIVNSGKIIKSVEIPNGVEKELNLVTQKSLSKTLPIETAETEIKSNMKINTNIKAPITKGDVLGKITYTLNGKNLGEINLLANKSIEEKTIYKTLRRIKDPRNISAVTYMSILILVYIVWRTIVTTKRIRRRRYY